MSALREPLLVLLALVLVPHLSGAQVTITVPLDPEDPTMDPAQMIARHGYPAESHLVTTEDGYILTLHRIPVSPERAAGEGAGHPVLLQHGLVASSADWIISGPGRALAYMLADLGYDVWLGNARGNTYSRAHRNLSASDPKFWDFSWHEMGYYDLPAVTEFILAESCHPDLTYVGHSMGTTMFWVFCTTRPHLQHRVRQMHALAPVAFMSRMRSPLRNLAPFVRQLQVVLALLGEHEFLPHGELRSFLVQEFLRVNHLSSEGAEYVLFFICGFDPEQFNKTLLPSILGHTPAGASTQSVIHYLQEVKSGKFRQYDEGTAAGNERRYGAPEPPEYDLSQLEVPVAMQYSLNDWLANPDDVKELFGRLRKPVGLFQVPLKTFNHLDYLWANDARSLVYERITQLMREASERARGRLARERLEEDYEAAARNLAPAQAALVKHLRERHSQLAASYDAILKRLGPSYQYLLKQMQQLNEREMSQELARRWGPGVVARLERLQARLQQAQPSQQESQGDSPAPRDPATSPQAPNWYDVRSYPSLLAVRSSPLVSRMLSTLQAQMEAQELPEHQKNQEQQPCQCGGTPSHACKRSPDSAQNATKS